MDNQNRIVFLSGRITNLRPFSRADVPTMTRWINSPEIRPYLTSVMPKTEKWEEDWYNKLGTADDNVTLCIETKEGRPIGIMSIRKIDWVHRIATTGAMIGEKEFWGGGYGTDAKLILLDYAFNVLNLHKVKSGAIAYNERSIRYSLRCGYKVEGRLREEKYRDGKYHDVIQLAVFREDWLPIYKRYMETGSVR